MLRIDTLQNLPAEAFVRSVGGAVENSPWVARRAFEARPFADAEALAGAMRSAILQASRTEQLDLLKAHPELAGREAAEGRMTRESTGEQDRLGLLALQRGQLDELRSINVRYRERFGFPLIVALRLHSSLDTVFAEARRRLAQDQESEREAALQQVCEVMRGRIAQLVDSTSPATKELP